MSRPFDQCKIWIGKDQELNAKVQEALFKLGYEWYNDNEKLGHDTVRHTKSLFLYTSHLINRFGTVMEEGYEKQNYETMGKLKDLKEITPQEVIDMAAMYLSEPIRDQLKSGMRVTTRDGKYFMVFLDVPDLSSVERRRDILVNSQTHSWAGLETWSNQLMHDKSDLDIVEISEFTGAAQNITDLHRTAWTPIWKREDKTKTVSFGGETYTEEEYNKLLTSIQNLGKEFS